MAEEVILFQVARNVSTGTTPKDEHEAVRMIKCLSGWMSVLLNANATNDMLQSMGDAGTQSMGSIAVKTAVGTVLVALADNAIAISALQKSCPKGT